VGADEWRSSKTLDLLRVLALNGGRPMSVASVVDRLWPAVDWDHGRASLRTAASQLRKVLGVDCLERQPGSLALTGVWVDTWAYTGRVHEVEQARRAGDCEAVVALVREAEGLYAGDVHVTSGEWDAEAHEWFRAQRLRMLLDGAEAAAARGWLRDSLDLAGRAGGIELTEEVARALMRSHASIGETDRALEVYEQLRHDLADRLGVDPSPQTKALHMMVLSGSSAPPLRWRHVGVEGAVGDLVAAARRVLDGSASGSVVWLCGPDGSGRRTVADLAARQLGLPLYDLSKLPFDAYSPEVLDGPDRSASPGVVLLPSRSLPPSWAVSIVHALAKRCPGVVVVRATEAPAELVAGEEGADALVRVKRLGLPDFEELAGLLLQGSPAPALVEELWGQSAGFAGAACRVAREWVREGRIAWGPGGLHLAGVPEGGTERSLGPPAAVLRSLDGASLDVLSVLAVAGSTLSPVAVSRTLAALGRPVRADEVLAGLVDRGLVDRRSGGVGLGSALVSGALASWIRPSAAARIEESLQRLVREDVVVQAQRLAAQGQTALAMAVARDQLRQARAGGDLDGVREMVDLMRELRRARPDEADVPAGATEALPADLIPTPRLVSFGCVSGGMAAAPVSG
jgi:DNA-binding SARP family transcriptional activator